MSFVPKGGFAVCVGCLKAKPIDNQPFHSEECLILFEKKVGVEVGDQRVGGSTSGFLDLSEEPVRKPLVSVNFVLAEIIILCLLSIAYFGRFKP